MRDLFANLAKETSSILGAPWSFFVAGSVAIIWMLSGPLTGYSQTWQLILNISTTFIIFLMVFIIQKTQNRDSKSVELKLNGLLRVSNDARKKFIDLEEMSEEELQKDQMEFRYIAKRQIK